MTVSPVEGCSGLYEVDTHFLDRARRNATYIYDGPRPTIVETGASPGVENVFGALDELNIEREELEWIAVTHVHLDHAGASGYLAEVCPNARVICHRRGVDFLSDEEKIERLLRSMRRAVGELAEGYGDLKPIPEARIVPVEGGETFDLGPRALEVVPAPGHAPHQVSFYDTRDRVMFTGDAAGMWLDDQLKVTTPPPNFDLDQSLVTLQTLSSYELDGLIYPHFGRNPRPYETLSNYEDLLQQWVDEVRTLWEETGNREDVVRELVNRDDTFYDLWRETVARETIRINTEGVLLSLESEPEKPS